MRLSVIAVGSKMPVWVAAGVEEYDRRMPPELKTQWLEIPLARRTKDNNIEALCQQEGEKILKAIPAGDRAIALDVRGKSLTTEQLAEQLRLWQMSGDSLSFLIGGPDGLSKECLARADQRWSLSDLTLPHPLVRILLAEQLYRAWTITANHPYHRQ